MSRQLKAFECSECGRQALLMQGFCSNCRSINSCQAIEVNGKGTVFSYTRIHVAEERFKGETPYLIAVIECDEGLRLLARIKESEKIAIGSRVVLDEWNEDIPIFRVS